MLSESQGLFQVAPESLHWCVCKYKGQAGLFFIFQAAYCCQHCAWCSLSSCSSFTQPAGPLLFFRGNEGDEEWQADTAVLTQLFRKGKWGHWSGRGRQEAESHFQPRDDSGDEDMSVPPARAKFSPQMKEGGRRVEQNLNTASCSTCRQTSGRKKTFSTPCWCPLTVTRQQLLWRLMSS